jgi:hypothetical protein
MRRIINACRFAKLYVVHMGYLGDAREMPGGCPGDARGMPGGCPGDAREMPGGF